MSPECGEENEISTAPYITFSAILFIVFAAHILLFAHTMYHEYIQKKDHEFGSKRGKVRMMRILYILLQIVAITWLIIELSTFFIDPYTNILRNNIGCKLFAYAAYYPSGIYYGLYLYQLSLRLETSFQGSYLALKQWVLTTLQCLILLVPITWLIGVSVDRHDLDCIVEWHPSDINRIVTYCTVQFHLLEVTPTVSYGCIGLANLLNLTHGVIFTLKLRQFVHHQSDNARIGSTREQFKFAALIIRNNTLTIIGVVSTISGYIIFVMTPPGQPVMFYIDNLINCLVIGLMFRCNDWYYKRLCSLCIICCFRECDPYEKEEDRSKLNVMAAKYVHGEITATEGGDSMTLPRIHLSSISSQSPSPSAVSS